MRALQDDTKKEAGIGWYRTEVLLSVYTGYLLCENFSDFHGAVEQLAGFPVWTHQIPRVCRRLKTELAKHLPWLAFVTVPVDDPVHDIKNTDFREAWVSGIAAMYGATHELSVLIADVEAVDPIAELAGMTSANRVIAVSTRSPNGANYE